MPRLPNLPQWTTARNFRRYETLTASYQARNLTWTNYRQQIVALINKERQEVEARNEAYNARLDKAIEKRRIVRTIKNAVRNNQTATLPLTDLDTTFSNARGEKGFVNFLKEVVRLEGRLEMKIGDTYYVLSDRTRPDLLRIINREITIQELVQDSWGQFVETYQNLQGNIEIRNLPMMHQNNNNGGAFFKYTHNTDLDLTRYGIFKTGEKQNHDDTCLIVALEAGGLEDAKLEKLKHVVKNRIIPLVKLKEICEIAKIQIVLQRNDSHHTKTIYGKEYGTDEENIFTIGYIDEHYFLVEPVQITSYALKHYHELKHLPNFHCIYNDKNHRKSDRFINSFQLITILLESPHLIKEMSIEERVIASTQFYDNVNQEIKSLEYNVEECVRPVEPKQKSEKIKYENLFFDFETDPNGIHKPYLVCIYSKNYKKEFIGEDCALQMLNYLYYLGKNFRLIAHNASYDYRFLINHLWSINEISRGNRLISLTAKFGSASNGKKPIHLHIKDSYLLISKPLRDFPSIFKLDFHKEVMPYTLYTQENIKKRFVPISEALELIAVEDRPVFLENLKKWKVKRGSEYDIIEYSSRYCQIDCKLLHDGYNTFRGWIVDELSIDIDDVLTAASLAHQYFVGQGCYEGVVELGGVPQMFIQGSVVGGRTMTARNEKISIQEIVNDFDAVSLYPSAMSRMDGFLKGVPKVLDTTDYNVIKNYDGYFVDIKITKVGIHRAFPLMSYKNEEGIRTFSNDMVGRVIRVDKVALEDLITFQQVEFEVIRGYYFNEGFNTKINETIRYTFQKRLALKKQGNPAQEIYKLIMNSGYGKSIMKPVEAEQRYFDDEDTWNTYYSRNYNWITSYVKFGSKVKVKSVKTLVEHFNIAHVGSSILSWSKRIMNEVFCTAEDNGIDMYYQDTDSCHLKDADIPKLARAFQEKYGRVLIGKDMGQFHSDFQMEGCKDIVARRSIFLGKKSYIDELEGVNAEGEKVIDYHIRMKGIPEKCLLYASKKQGYDTIFALYQALLKGTSVEVDLTNDGTKANFKFNNDHSIQTLSYFKRTIRF